MRRQLLYLIPLAVVLVAAGCKKGLESAGNATNAGRYEMTVDGAGFHPSQLTLAVGVPATIVVTRTTDQTCAKEMVIPSLNLRKALPLNQPVEFAVTPSAKGQINFACGMNMLSGVIEVH